MKASCLVDGKYTLGESCFWDPRSPALWWTDIEGSSVFRWVEGGDVSRFTLPGRAGFILPRETSGFVIGFPNQIALANSELTQFQKIAEIETDDPRTRINDAAVDPYGGIVFGTCDETPDRERRQPVSSVYRLAPNGVVAHLFGGVTVSNGLAFSPSGQTMYFADTNIGTIRRFHVSENFSGLSEREPLAGIDVAPGKPDGAEVDSEGHYWSARVRGACIARISPDGQVGTIVEVPANGPTCVALGGPGRRQLFITSLRAGQSASELESCPHSGGIFCAEVEVPGIEQRLVRL